MKHILRLTVFCSFTLWITSEILPTLAIHSGWQSTIFAGIVFALLILIVKPILKILFLPINFLTFGLLSWLINVIVVFLLTTVVADVHILPWNFPGATYAGFVVPPMSLSFFWSLTITSLVLTASNTMLHAISDT